MCLAAIPVWAVETADGRNIAAGGASFDFFQRDALAYHVADALQNRP